MHRVIKFNQKASLKSYNDLKTNLKKKKKRKKNDFKKDFFKLMNNAVFEKNVRTHRDINLETTEARSNYLVPEPNYHTTKFFSENFLAIEMKKHEYLLLNLSI